MVLASAAAFEPLEGCETDFTPSPPVQADRDAELYVWLQGPWSGPTVTMRLKRPELQDARGTRYGTVANHMQDGSLYLYKRQRSNVRLSLRWASLSRKKLLEVENFLSRTAGQAIRYVDHEGRTWRGYILTPAPGFLTSHRPDYAGEFTIEFEGENVT